jgi:hypothetical protein
MAVPAVWWHDSQEVVSVVVRQGIMPCLAALVSEQRRLKFLLVSVHN